MGAADSTRWPPMRQLPLEIGLEPSVSFESFVPGPNREALAQMHQLAAELAADLAAELATELAPPPAAPPRRPPVYLWGEPGSGKSHLLLALAGELQRRGRKLGWFAPGQPRPWEFNADWAALVFDGADRFDADEQAAAFALFIEATALGLPVLAAGRVPPVDLPLRDDLRTRLAWGLVYETRTPGDADTRAALRRQADERGLILKDEMLEHLLTHFPRDLGALSSLLERLDRYSLATTRRITLPMLRAMLDEEAQATTSALLQRARGGGPLEPKEAP